MASPGLVPKLRLEGEGTDRTRMKLRRNPAVPGPALDLREGDLMASPEPVSRSRVPH
jgi:hypothetical protein